MNLLDILQAASNAAASTVTGPVDMLGWGLRKAGLPVPEDAVGSTAWAKKKGLLRDVEDTGSRVVGETLGLLSPAVVAAKAPQIAGGLLKMGENAAKPRTMNPQKGAIVWHGSPHKFDRFDSSKIGTGEGAQAYGHGIYVADSPDVARGYKEKLSDVHSYTVNGKAISIKSGSPEQDAAWTLDVYRGDLEGAISGSVGETKRVLEMWRNAAIEKNNGNLYKVDLPDSAIARMLDWDKPLSQQAPEVRGAVRKAIGVGEGPAWVKSADAFPSVVTDTEHVAQLNRLAKTAPQMVADEGYRMVDPLSVMTGKDLHFMLGGRAIGSEAKGERALRAAGIPGIRYLDGGSRGAGAGTSNYVVFPGEEGLLKILERNGAPLP